MPCAASGAAMPSCRVRDSGDRALRQPAGRAGHGGSLARGSGRPGQAASQQRDAAATRGERGDPGRLAARTVPDPQRGHAGPEDADGARPARGRARARRHGYAGHHAEAGAAARGAADSPDGQAVAVERQERRRRIAIMQASLVHADWSIRWRAVRNLGRLLDRRKELAEPLRRALSDEHPSVRIAALRALPKKDAAAPGGRQGLGGAKVGRRAHAVAKVATA